MNRGAGPATVHGVTENQIQLRQLITLQLYGSGSHRLGQSPSRPRKVAVMFPRACFPSLLGSSEWTVSLQRLTGRNAAESLRFGSLPFSMERVLGSASGPPDQCVCSGGGLLGHTGELRGPSSGSPSCLE